MHSSIFLFLFIYLMPFSIVEAMQIPSNHSMTAIHSSVVGKIPKGPAVIQFWAPWCHSCGSVIWDLDPILNRFAKIRFVSINIDKNHAKAKSYIQKHHLYDKYMDSFYTSPSDNLIVDLGVRSVPLIIVTNKKGQVIYRQTAHLNADTKGQLIEAIQSVILKPISKEKQKEQKEQKEQEK